MSSPPVRISSLSAPLAGMAGGRPVINPQRARGFCVPGVPGAPVPSVRHRGAALADDHPGRADSRVAPPGRVVVDGGDSHGRRRDRRNAAECQGGERHPDDDERLPHRDHLPSAHGRGAGSAGRFGALTAPADRSRPGACPGLVPNVPGMRPIVAACAGAIYRGHAIGQCR